MTVARWRFTLVRETNGDRATEVVEAELAVPHFSGALEFFDDNRNPGLVIAPGQWTRVERGVQVCTCANPQHRDGKCVVCGHEPRSK